jgi:hypothetical protein
LDEVLPGAGDQQHAAAVALRQFVELGGDAGGQRQVAAHRVERRATRFAVLPGEGGAGEHGCRDEGQHVAQESGRFHQRSLSL